MSGLDLTLEEKEALRQALINPTLLSAIRKVEANDADYWRRMGRGEALSDDPKVALLVKYAAREAAAMSVEGVLKKAVGIQKVSQEE